MSNTKNDAAWQKLFDKYDILHHVEHSGSFEITSEQINEFREARLMTKFDHRKNLPKIFADRDLSILPITRGSYVIAAMDAYKAIEEMDTGRIHFPFPTHIESIDFENITSEAAALNGAYVSGILADFMEDEEIMPTVSGRMSSNTFHFTIRNTQTNSNMDVHVVNAQIEIDGGYEGKRTLALIEAKNSLSDDFLIRQLYYPYRLWSSLVSKKVRPIFMMYSNGIFSFYEYEFLDSNNYNSLTLLRQKNYRMERAEIKLEDIAHVLQHIHLIEEPEIPFPQADSFKRIINLCELLYEGELTRDEITTNYDFDPRQTNYYTDAGRYLGVMQKRMVDGQVVYSLTEGGQGLFALTHMQRQLKLVALMVRHRPFYEVLRMCLIDERMPERGEVVQIMKNSNLYNVKSDDTYNRRASTVIAWVNWILGLPR